MSQTLERGTEAWWTETSAEEWADAIVAAIHTAWRGGYPVLMTAGTGPRIFPGSMRGARGSSSGGWGSSASFGVKLARPDHDVIHDTGDGYFMFGTPLPALWAAGHHKTGYMAVVFVNGSYSAGASGLRQAYPEGYGIAAANYEGGTFEPRPISPSWRKRSTAMASRSPSCHSSRSSVASSTPGTTSRPSSPCGCPVPCRTSAAGRRETLRRTIS